MYLRLAGNWRLEPEHARGSAQSSTNHTVSVQRRHRDVRDNHRRHVRSNGSLEGRQLHSLQALQIVGDARQLQVAILQVRRTNASGLSASLVRGYTRAASRG